MKIIIKSIFAFLSIPIFSRIWGKLARLTHPRFIIRYWVRLFSGFYKIDMSQFTGNLDNYLSLADFFIRKLDPKVRSLKKDPWKLVSPADGFVAGYEMVTEDNAVQAKGISYKITELINQDLDFSHNWHVATIYLAPKDYHRFHYPADSLLEKYCWMKGSLYPVNKTGIKNIKGLFVKNERIVVRFSINDLSCYVVAVGATFVGSIKMNFINQVKRDGLWHDYQQRVTQLSEMGRFEMGSTIIMVCPQQLVQPLPDLKGKSIRVGQPLFIKKS